ncbi:DUF2264 domain-containing protein [Dysgonomonas capnocytophagoides]|uniref:DUF2264 domain-containing protein n=1 Tax=Dysgonomonas capnocytophagoides TaxID=45254 RepID=UPI0029272B0A|nr:DUF2264 domain-containing protein [Dysgonomonas capnocytophagoides]
MKKIVLGCILITGLYMPPGLHAQKGDTSIRRMEWVKYLDKISNPVMANLANNQLHEKMPVSVPVISDDPVNRKKVAYLEIFGRTLSGIAPWLNSEGGSTEEISLRNQYRQWSLQAIDNATNPSAKDYVAWTAHIPQPLVDASYVALALIRSPWLWNNLSTKVKEQVVAALKETRATVPVYNNWILFTSMIEAFFCKYDIPYDAVRIDYGIREFMEHWYVGDGMFSDGIPFNINYYNSYVIQPYMSTIMDVMIEKTGRYRQYKSKLDTITKRYAELQERWINTDGSYPPTGRSIVYRGAAFQHLANMALIKRLPTSITEGQVRAGLTAVIRKTLDAPNTFSSEGWLNLGIYGNQPGLADEYNNTGSLYICNNIFLPLGLSPDDSFWTCEDQPWTSVKIWSGQDVQNDHALELR